MIFFFFTLAVFYCLGIGMEKVEARFFWEWGFTQYDDRTGCKGLEDICKVGIIMEDSEIQAG